MLAALWAPASSPEGRDSSARICASTCSSAGHRVICLDNLDTGTLENIEHIRDENFVFINQDITEFVEIEEPVDFVYHLASPASPIDYARLPLHTLKVGSYGTHHMLGRGEVQAGAVPARLDLGGLRRPRDPPPARGLLGQRQPDRPARRLRRGQALRRGDDDGLPPPAGRQHLHRPDLQHLRPADAPARRPRHPDLPAPGAPGQAAHRLRRRQPDPELLLRRRPDPRARRRSPSPTSTCRSTSATRTSTRCCSSPRR